MAEFDTVRSVGVGARAQIDEGLRAHMNKVYGLMSVAMLVTAGVAWSVGTSDALLAIFRDPLTLRPNILGWVVMFAPLAMVFAFGALLFHQVYYLYSACQPRVRTYFKGFTLLLTSYLIIKSLSIVSSLKIPA